ncbi:MAG: c-type cytochrome [Pseudomonadota bacterium]
MKYMRPVLLAMSLFMVGTVFVTTPVSPAVADDVSGKRLYRDGLLPSGEPVRAVVKNGTVWSGADAACVKCHRRSGLGDSEGRYAIRPIAGRLLFEYGNAAAGTSEHRPTYTQATLARALRDGVDPSGRTLDSLMPRYDLSDGDVAQLAAYLRELSSGAVPGVGDTAIHFATIVAPGVEPAKAMAMLDVLHAFFGDKNAGTRKESRRRAVGREQMYRAYRTWELHVWELTGPAETWRDQLEASYREQPVFALLGGIGAGDWQPVHAFCEHNEIPCVFPDVDFPVVAESDYYSIYFSRGVTLEAEVLAKYLAEETRQGRRRSTEPIMQVFRDDAAGRMPAQALRAALRREGMGNPVDRTVVAGSDAVATEFWAKLLSDGRGGTLVVWLNGADVQSLAAAGALPADMRGLYLSASLLSGKRPTLPAAWSDSLDKVRLVYPFDLPVGREQRLARMKTWLRAKNIPLSDERIQANAYFAATVVGDAVTHMLDNFSRDYFIERIEHVTGKSLSSAIYPRLSLGPGQRFASKGGYVVRFAPDGENRLVPLSGWIIP